MEPPPTLTGLSTYLLSKVGKDARGRLAERLAARDLRLWHLATLAALRDFGPHAQRDLAERLTVDRSDITKIVDDLTRSGYVQATRDPSDRRRVSVAVTADGEAALCEMDAEARAVQDEILAPLDAAEREQLQSLLYRVFEHGRRPSR